MEPSLFFHTKHFHRVPGPNFRFQQFTNPLCINAEHGAYVPERIIYLSKPFLHTLKPTDSSSSLEQLEKENVEDGSDRDLHLPINLRFTEKFWHSSKYFFARVDRQDYYLKTTFTRDVVFTRITTPSTSKLVFLHSTQRHLNNQTHKVNRSKLLHTVHNYPIVQHNIHRTNPLIHINSRLQYANTKLTSPYYFLYSYVIKPKFCEGTLRNFNPIKYYLLFPPLYIKAHRPLPVPIEYLKCVERGATKCLYGHTFNLLYRNWIGDRPQ